ncbi:hypothetical protein Tco_0064500 [Tanacetum coccineum]
MSKEGVTISHIPQSSGPPIKVGDEAVHKELGDRMEKAATTTSSLEAEQDSGSGPRCQDTILRDVDAQTRFEITSKQSNDPPLSRGYTFGSGEDCLKLLELMELMRPECAGPETSTESLGGERDVRLVEVEGAKIPRERNVEGANRGAPDFSTVIAQQLQNLLPTMLAQVSNRGNVGNQNGCSYKEFLACNPKEYDGKGGAVVLTRWIEKMENVQDMSGYSNDQKVKYTAGSFVVYDDTQEFCPSHEMQKLESNFENHAMVGLAMLRILIGFMSWRATEPKTMQKAMQISGALTDEAVRNGSIKKVKKKELWRKLARIRMVGRHKRTRDLGMVIVYYCKPCLEPSDLGFKYEIEIASGQLVEIDKSITRETRTRKRIVMSAKASDKKQEEIIVVRDFPKVFLDYLSGLSPIQEIEFRIELIPRATPVAKSPYHLAPSKMEELSRQLKELQDKGFIQPSSSP